MLLDGWDWCAFNRNIYVLICSDTLKPIAAEERRIEEEEKKVREEQERIAKQLAEASEDTILK